MKKLLLILMLATDCAAQNYCPPVKNDDERIKFCASEMQKLNDEYERRFVNATTTDPLIRYVAPIYRCVYDGLYDCAECGVPKGLTLDVREGDGFWHCPDTGKKCTFYPYGVKK